MSRIYVDHAATAPIYPAVMNKMMEVMKNQFGNPSSIHSFGREARRLIDEARSILAECIGAQEKEIIFTSGGTEADNLALFGVAKANAGNGRHIITTAVEHHAILHVCEQLEKDGFEVTYLPVDEAGFISLDDFHHALRDDTILVSIMLGNNEVGTLQPIKKIGQMLSNHQAIFHTDAVQAFGLEIIDVNDLHVDLLSVSAHKISGPNGIGFLYVREGVQFTPLQFGGAQERKRRAGTENVAAVVGFKEATLISQRHRDAYRQKYFEWKKYLIDYLEKEQVRFQVNGQLDTSLPHILNVSFPGVDVEALLVNLDLAGIAASSGSACTAGSFVPSHVLVAMYGEQSLRLHNSVRISFGISNTNEQIHQLASEIVRIVKRLTTV